MRLFKKSEKAVLSLVLVIAILMSVIACTIVTQAEVVDDLSDQSADNYYLWGQNSNDPDFGSMTAPTGSFSYDGTKGYYYYDLQSASGDYCFVVSKINNSGATAVRTPAVGGVQSSGKYYLAQGNYHGYACMHLWNPSGDAIRIYFTSENAGLNAIAQSEVGNQPTQQSTTAPNPTTSPNPTTAPQPGDNYVYCKNDAGWGAVYAYMWNSDSDRNSAWPGVKMTDLGSGTWRYAVPSNYANIIFNNGSDAAKTEDMTYPGAGKMYNNATGQWTVYGGSTDPTQKPTTSPNPTTPTPTTPTPTTAPGKNVVYCENEAGWSVVTAYMWNSENDKNFGWPGVQMTNVGNNIWQYNIPKNFAKVIFSNNGQSQTEDLNFPGSGYIYNNKTKTWSVYDTSPLQVQSFTTDLASPQLSGVGVMLSAEATGQGTVTYKFSVQNSSGSTVFTRDYSVVNTAMWTASAVGKYTITYDFKDTSGNTNKRTLSYEITDGTNSVAPYIKTITPAPGSQIKNGTACSISVTAGGGKTGTNLLFYKYTVTDSSGKIVNVPYYTRNTSYSFTPNALNSTYTVTVSVQGSDNTTVERSCTYKSVGTITTPTEPPTVKPTQKPTNSGSDPTQPSSGFLKGDADGDGEISILDATRIQRRIAELVTAAEIKWPDADADGDGELTILDATHIQRFIANLISVM